MKVKGRKIKVVYGLFTIVVATGEVVNGVVNSCVKGLYKRPDR